MDQPPIDRRQFVKQATAATAAVTVALPLALASCAQHGPPPPPPGPVDAGPLTSVTAAPGGVNASLLRTHHVLLVVDRDRLHAISSVCPHRGCDVEPNPDRRAGPPLACPCHDSDFDAQGRPTGGPARKPLTRLAVAVDPRGHVIVDTSRPFAPDQWDDPAAFVRLTG